MPGLFVHNVAMPFPPKTLHNQPRTLAAGLVAISLAYWAMQVWQWSAPLQPLQPVVVQQQASAVQSQWASLLQPASPGSKPPVASTLSQWQVLGIVSTQAEQGIAMMRSPSGEELLVRTGEALAPGLVLQQVTDVAVHIAMPGGQVQLIQAPGAR